MGSFMISLKEYASIKKQILSGLRVLTSFMVHTRGLFTKSCVLLGLTMGYITLTCRKSF